MEDFDRVNSLVSVSGLDSPLLFSFKKGLAGLDYILLQDGAENLFLSSPLLVRDRKQLQQSSDWENNKHKFFFGVFFVRVDGCIYLCSQNVWSPSVDAVLLIEAIKEHKDIFDQCTSLFDLGCGTGVTSIGLLNSLKSVSDILMYDINPKASMIAAINLYLNCVERNVTFLSKESLSTVKADICVTTPYYVPVEKKITLSPQEDIRDAIDTTVFMINSSIEHCEKYTVFVFSSCTEKEVRERIPYHVEILKAREILFTIGDNVGNNEVVKRLIDDGRLKNINGDYYHTVYVGLVSKKRGSV